MPARRCRRQLAISILADAVRCRCASWKRYRARLSAPASFDPSSKFPPDVAAFSSVLQQAAFCRSAMNLLKTSLSLFHGGGTTRRAPDFEDWLLWPRLQVAPRTSTSSIVRRCRLPAAHGHNTQPLACRSAADWRPCSGVPGSDSLQAVARPHVVALLLQRIISLVPRSSWRPATICRAVHCPSIRPGRAILVDQADARASSPSTMRRKV